jgi:hypothetical protein
MLIECVYNFQRILNINSSYFPTKVKRLDFLPGSECLL